MSLDFIFVARIIIGVFRNALKIESFQVVVI